MKLQEQAIVAGPLPETARGQTQRASDLAQDASAPPRLPKKTKSAASTTVTQHKQRQVGSHGHLKELDLPTKLELSRGPTCESGPVTETCADCFLTAPVWNVCSLVAAADLSLEQQTARLGEKRDRRNSCSTKRRVWI